MEKPQIVLLTRDGLIRPFFVVKVYLHVCVRKTVFKALQGLTQPRFILLRLLRGYGIHKNYDKGTIITFFYS